MQKTNSFVKLQFPFPIGFDVRIFDFCPSGFWQHFVENSTVVHCEVNVIKLTVTQKDLVSVAARKARWGSRMIGIPFLNININIYIYVRISIDGAALQSTT